MKAVLRRQGDVFTMTVPADAIEASGLQDADEVEVTVAGLSVDVRRPRITLHDIVAELKQRGPPPPIEWDDWEPVGTEVW